MIFYKTCKFQTRSFHLVSHVFLSSSRSFPVHLLLFRSSVVSTSLASIDASVRHDLKIKWGKGGITTLYTHFVVNILMGSVQNQGNPLQISKRSVSLYTPSDVFFCLLRIKLTAVYRASHKQNMMNNHITLIGIFPQFTLQIILTSKINASFVIEN